MRLSPWALLGAACIFVGCGGNSDGNTDGEGGSANGGEAGSNAGNAGGGVGGISGGGSAGDGGVSGSGGDGGASGAGGSAGSSGAGGTVGESEPTRLSETGLYADIANDEIAADVHAYQPKYGLWSDGATKRRWIKLPAGATIDTSDMDFWKFPNGTKLFKEFTRDGVRVETRMILKHGPGDWFMMAYQWNDEQTEANAVPNGVVNASGTQHDIPAREDCSTCHGSMQDRVLGFTALQLSHDLGGGLNLDQVKTMGWLTNPPAGNFIVPGSPVAEKALGYLHANCGMCHNQNSKVYKTRVDIDLWFHSDKLGSVEETPTYLTAVNQNTTGSISHVAKRIAPGDPDNSAIYELMALRGFGSDVDAGAVDAAGGASERQMPPVGTEIVDPTGLAEVEAWINELNAP